MTIQYYIQYCQYSIHVKAICDNIWLFIFFVIGIAWIALVVVFDVILLREAWPFVFDRASDAVSGAVDDAVDGIKDGITNGINDSINDVIDNTR